MAGTANRATAKVGEDGVVLFLIGTRINKPWRLDKWLWVPFAMGRMLMYLSKHPESGLIRARNWFGRTTMQVGYWRSAEDLIAFAAANSAPHAAAWRRFNRAVGTSGAVGIWHETYVVRPGTAECIYVDMPPFGLGEATELVPVDRSTHSARKRLGLAGPAQPAQPADTARPTDAGETRSA
jgi:hypothetical protein